ncbi:MAG: hypothetical protein AMXMBFR33_32040 [Candidatus Xenobia bacterium]
MINPSQTLPGALRFQSASHCAPPVTPSTGRPVKEDPPHPNDRYIPYEPNDSPVAYGPGSGPSNPGSTGNPPGRNGESGGDKPPQDNGPRQIRNGGCH